MLDDPTSRSGAQIDIGDLTSFDLKDILDPAHYVDSFLFICTTVLTVIGVPANLMIIGAILFLKRLRFSRNVIWVGIGVSNIIVLVSRLMFVKAAHSETSTASTRGFYTWFGCISVFSLTFNITAAIFERHICLTYPKWYRRSVTINWILALEFSFFGCIILILLAVANLEVFQPYLSTFFDSWNVKLLGTLVTMISPLILSGFVAFLALVKQITEQDITQQEIVQMKNLSVNIKHNLLPGNYRPNDRKNKNRTAADANREKSAKPITNHFILIGNSRQLGGFRISQLDLGAKQTFIYIAFIYLIFMVPTLISFISVLICLLNSPTSCSSFMGALYLIGVIMDCIHSSIINPVAFVLFSKDVLELFKSRGRRNAYIIKEKFQVDGTSNHNKMETINEEPDEETET